MTLVIRLAQERDIPILQELYSQFTDWNLRRQEVIRKAISEPNCELLVAEYCQGIIGFAHQVFVLDIVHAGLCSYVTSIFVKENCRRKGVASKLLLKALASAKEQKVVEVHLDTEERNEQAIKFYESLGFKKVGMTFERNPRRIRIPRSKTATKFFPY